MTMARWTADEHGCQSAAVGHVPADWTGLARTLLDLCAQAAVLSSVWWLF
jgi:hypothetical protein